MKDVATAPSAGSRAAASAEGGCFSHESRDPGAVSSGSPLELPLGLLKRNVLGRIILVSTSNQLSCYSCQTRSRLFLMVRLLVQPGRLHSRGADIELRSSIPIVSDFVMKVEPRLIHWGRNQLFSTTEITKDALFARTTPSAGFPRIHTQEGVMPLRRENDRLCSLVLFEHMLLRCRRTSGFSLFPSPIDVAFEDHSSNTVRFL